MSAERMSISDYRGYYILTYIFLLNGEKSLYISELHANNKGCGYGNSLLKEILERADEEHISVCLHANSSVFDDEDGLSQQDLEDWYFRNGFNRVYDLCPNSTNFFYREAN